MVSQGGAAVKPLDKYLKLLGQMLEARANDEDETPVCDELDGVWRILDHGERATANLAAQLTCVVTTYTRDDLVRAILGQQWAVAMCLMSPEAWAWAGDHGGSRVGQSDWNNRLAALPCAVDVVEGMEQS